MVIDANVENMEGQQSRISKSFTGALFSFARITFLFEPLEMIGKLVAEDEGFEAFCLCFNGVIQVCLKVIVLGLHLGTFLGYRWEVSMFIAKNVVMIFVRTLECVAACLSDNLQNEPQNERPPPTAPTSWA